MKHHEKLLVGEQYSRKKLMTFLDEEGLKTNREGIYYCKQEKTTLIFTDLIKQGKYSYKDYFEEDFFHWDSQTKQHIDTPKIKEIVNQQVEVLLFCRLYQKIKEVTQPFIYCGRLKYYQHEKSKPVHIIYESLDYDDESKNKELLKIWGWIPSNKGSKINKSSVVSERRKNNYLPPNLTEREGLVTSRVGQGYFRQQLLNRWNKKCAVMNIGLDGTLIASHILAWKNSNNKQRLDVGNGILLSPNLDSLFDKHLISFDDDGAIMISKKLEKKELEKISITKNLSLVKVFEDMLPYLKNHRKIFFQTQDI